MAGPDHSDLDQHVAHDGQGDHDVVPQPVQKLATFRAAVVLVPQEERFDERDAGVVVAHQFRDQLDDLSKGSTLNVGNLIVFRTTGRDGFDLASQFDNTPPPPEKVMEPIYRPYKNTEDGKQLFTAPKSTTGVGSLYHEVERIRRTYSDVQGEMANRLSILPNYQAWCRLIYDPESRGEKKKPPHLVEYNFITEELGKEIEDEEKDKIASQIREQSRKLAKPRLVVEADIMLRSLGEINTGDIETSESLE